MTVSLGGIVLSDHLILSGIEQASLRSINPRRLLGGRMHIQVGPALERGRTLTLSGENHFSLEQIRAAKDLEALGQEVTLVHHRGTFTVIITGTPVEPTINYADPSDDDWYSGEITMIEV